MLGLHASHGEIEFYYSKRFPVGARGWGGHRPTFSLEVWASNTKVLNVAWNDKGQTEIVSFKRKTLEAALEKEAHTREAAQDTSSTDEVDLSRELGAPSLRGSARRDGRSSRTEAAGCETSATEPAPGLSVALKISEGQDSGRSKKIREETSWSPAQIRRLARSIDWLRFDGPVKVTGQAGGTRKGKALPLKPQVRRECRHGVKGSQL